MKPLCNIASAILFASLSMLGADLAKAQIYGVAPAVSAGNVAALVVKAAPGTQLQVVATNATSTAGLLIGYNAIAAPSAGALTAALVLDCVALPASGSAVINDKPGPGTNYSIGITYLLSSAASCYTYTTGTITGFIKADYQ